MSISAASSWNSFREEKKRGGGAPINGDEIYIKSELIQSEAAFLTRVRVGLPL